MVILRHPPSSPSPFFAIRCGLFVAAGQHDVLLYNGFVAEEVFAEAVEVDSAADGCGAVHGEDVVGMLLDALQAGPVSIFVLLLIASLFSSFGCKITKEVCQIQAHLQYCLVISMIFLYF